MGEIGDELAHLLEGVGLHEDVVLGEQQGGDLAQLAHGRRVRVRDHVPVRGARRNEVSSKSIELAKNSLVIFSNYFDN